MRQSRLAKGAPAPVEKFKEHGEDFVVASTIRELVEGMNQLGRDGAVLDVDHIEAQIVARDRALGNAFSKDLQLMAINNARLSRTDKLIRVASPHRFLEKKNGPLIAVRLNLLSRKTPSQEAPGGGEEGVSTGRPQGA